MRRRRRGRGQALAEFAFVVPIMMLIGIGALDMGRVVLAMDTTANAAREAARFAIVHGGTVSFSPAASAAEIKQVARDAAIGATDDLTVTLCYSVASPTAITPAACTSDTNANRTIYVRGNPVTVVVTSNIGLLTTSLLGFDGFTVTGSSSMLINY